MSKKYREPRQKNEVLPVDLVEIGGDKSRNCFMPKDGESAYYSSPFSRCISFRCCSWKTLISVRFHLLIEFGNNRGMKIEIGVPGTLFPSIEHIFSKSKPNFHFTLSGM